MGKDVEAGDKLMLEACYKAEKGEFVEAFAMLLESYELGYMGACVNIGYAYDVGEGVEQDTSKALLWYKRAWRFNKEICACSNMATVYRDLGNRERALFWWRKAVAAGDKEAGLWLAKYLLETRPEAALGEAIELVRIAAEAEESLEITPGGKEEAEELLVALTSTPSR